MTDIREIPLCGNRGVAVVDAEDYDRLSQYYWYMVDNGWQYARRKEVGPDGTWHDVRMHHDVLSVEPGCLIDHINGNGLDNRRSNLRPCTHAENSRNSRKHRSLTSQYKGVSWSVSHNRWQVFIRSGGSNQHLGNFKSEIDAALAYNKAAMALHGEFACLNEITEVSNAD
jgi:hypothetical protein